MWRSARCCLYFAAGLMFLLGSSSYACNVVNVSGPGPGGQTGQPTVLDACNAVLAVARAGTPTRNYQLTATGGSADPTTYPPPTGQSGTCILDSNPYEAALRVQRSWVVVNDSTGTCQARPCSGSASDGVGDHWTTTHYPGADGYCNAVSHCRMRVSSSVGVDGVMVYSVQHTSETCVNGTHDADSSAAFSDGESCASSGANQFCLSNQGTNCGYLNDSFVCLPRVESDGCKVFTDGGRVCGASAPVPPVPDNGTAGVPATPVATVSSTVNNSTSNLNVFSGSQAAMSSRDPGMSGDNPYDGHDDGSGDGDCIGTDCGESESGSASGGESCDSPPTCSGDEIECMAVHQQWLLRCPGGVSGDDITNAVGTADALPSEEKDVSSSFDESLLASGALVCPSPSSFTVLGHEFHIDWQSWMCTFLERLAPIVMAMAYLLATFTVFGAVGRE